MTETIKILKRKKQNVLSKLRRRYNLLIGSVVEYHNVCGKPNCRCKKGEKHTVFCLTTKVDGKTVNYYIPKKKLAEARKMSENYKKLKGLLHELSDINYKLLKLKDK